jgi:thioredoxin-like negative regulator of GroEL
MAEDRISQLKEILTVNPADSFARYALGMEYSNSGQVDTAVAEFKTLLHHNPNYVNAYFMAAQALTGAQRNQEAIDLLRDGIATAQRTNNRHAESEMQELLNSIEN